MSKAIVDKLRRTGAFFVKGCEAVSYTHLDVYKRQVHALILQLLIDHLHRRRDQRVNVGLEGGFQGFETLKVME